jgi:tetratricopeptide (TPR) repeat protein
MISRNFVHILSRKATNSQVLPRNNRSFPRKGPKRARGAAEERSRRWLALGVALFVLACGLDPEARLEKIRSQQEANQFAETLEPLRELLKASPDDPELNHLYGSALLATKQPGLAIWSLRKAAGDPERAVEDGLLLAIALLGGGSPDDAVEQALRVLELAPDRIEVQHLLLKARLQAKQHEEVLEDAARLLALNPGEPEALMARTVALLSLNRPDEAGPALAELGAAVADLTGDANWQPRLCAATAMFAKENGDPDAAEARWNECLEQFPAEAVVVFEAIDFFAERPGNDRSVGILRRAHDADPTHLRFLEALAGRLGATGQTEEAEKLLRAAARNEGNEKQGWLALARYHEQRDEVPQARDAMAEALRLMGEAPQTIVAAYVDLLIRAGDYDEAEAIVAHFESPVMQHLLRGRLLLERGQPAQALEALDEGMRLWPDNSVARWLAGTAAERLGDYDRAAEEYGEAVRNDTGNWDAVRSLLRLLEAHGLDSEALPILRRYGSEHPGDPEMLVETMRFAHRAGSRNVLERATQTLRAIPGQRGVVAAELAAIRAVDAGPAAGIEAIRSAGLDLSQRVNGRLLDLLVGYLVADGRSDEALKLTGTALAAHPEEALFHELRGRALWGAGDPGAAREALQRALEFEPERATALAELAALTAEQGDRETALALYDRAALSDPAQAAYPWAAIQLLATGDDDDLERRLEALLARHGTHAAAANLLARRLLERDPKRALELAHRAVRFRGGPDALETLGRAEFEHDDAASAVETLGLSVELRPDSPSTHYWLGLALAATGDKDRARGALNTALVTEAFPEREAARAALARLDAN